MSLVVHLRTIRLVRVDHDRPLRIEQRHTIGGSEEWFAFRCHEAEDHPRWAACVVKLGDRRRFADFSG
jgi:hypothetical protein